MHYRETRDRAREVKFLIDAKTRPALIEWSRANLAADGHGAGVYADEYNTVTLYFETPEFDVFHRHRSFGRSKYRVRRYGHSDIVFLERKFRTDRLLAKRRTTVPVTDLEHLVAAEPDINWPGYWFHRRIKLRKLNPLIQMSYERVARIGNVGAGPVRMTIDTNLRVLPMPDRALIPGVGLPLIEDKCIVEVKYRIELPAMFKQMAEQFGLQIQKVSKYRLGLSVLDYAPKGPRAAVAAKAAATPAKVEAAPQT